MKRCRFGSSLRAPIDGLPDDVLVSIISLLNLTEAARTSVLSRRWQYLWRHTTGILDFVKCIPVVCDNAMHSELNIREASRSRFIKLVNQVLNLNKGCTEDELRVCFGITDESSDAINLCIKFALNRGVKRLMLIFTRYETSTPYAKYSLTKEVFTNCALGSLTSLHLVNVDMTRKVVGFVMSSSPLLQALHLNSVSSLTRLTIGGSSPNLRCLEIKHCLSMRRLEVEAVNIVSFTYQGPKIRLVFRKIPCLVEANLNELFLIKNIKKCSSYFSRLESLVLDLRDWAPESHWKASGGFPEFPEFKMLQRLSLSWSRNKVDSYIYLCTKLIRASPVLHSFALKVYTILGNEDDENNDIILPRKTVLSCSRAHLKVMGLIGFRGYTKDIDLALRLCDFRGLGKLTLVVNPWPISLPDQIGGWDAKKAVARARKLQEFLPTGVEMLIASHPNPNFCKEDQCGNMRSSKRERDSASATMQSSSKVVGAQVNLRAYRDKMNQ